MKNNSNDNIPPVIFLRPFVFRFVAILLFSLVSIFVLAENVGMKGMHYGKKTLEKLCKTM